MFYIQLEGQIRILQTLRGLLNNVQLTKQGLTGLDDRNGACMAAAPSLSVYCLAVLQTF